MSSDSAISIRQRFVFRARILGIFEWTCPECGTYNRSRMRPKTFLVRCGGAAMRCEKLYGVGYVLHETRKGFRSTPPDYVMPARHVEALQEGDVGRWWRNGHMMHCVHTATGTLAVPDIEGGSVAEAYTGQKFDHDAEAKKRRVEQRAAAAEAAHGK